MKITKILFGLSMLFSLLILNACAPKGDIQPSEVVTPEIHEDILKQVPQENSEANNIDLPAETTLDEQIVENAPDADAPPSDSGPFLSLEGKPFIFPPHDTPDPMSEQDIAKRQTEAEKLEEASNRGEIPDCSQFITPDIKATCNYNTVLSKAQKTGNASDCDVLSDLLEKDRCRAALEAGGGIPGLPN